MQQQDTLYDRATIAWLESVMPKPSHIPEGMEKLYGPNPLLHLCPLIAEYMGPNPFYSNPDSHNFSIKEKIKQMTAEKDPVFDVYDAFFYEMRNTNLSMIPTMFPQFDDILSPSLKASIGHLQPEQQIELNPAQQYIHQLLRRFNKFSTPSNGYIYRYLPPMTQNQVTTFSITNTTTLYDGSLLIFNENNIFLWPAKYFPPAPIPSLTQSDTIFDPNATNPQDRKSIVTSSTRTEDVVRSTQVNYELQYLLKNPSLASLNPTRFEDAYHKYISTYQSILRPTVAPNKQQLETNKSLLNYYISHQQQTHAQYKKNKVAKILPQLYSTPFLFHSYDISTNNYSSDLMLDRLPHQLSHKKLRMLRRRKREFLNNPANINISVEDLHRQFDQEYNLVLLDDDAVMLNDLSEDDFDDSDDFDDGYTSSDSDSSDEDEDDSDEYSSSGDNDSEETDTESSDDSDDNRRRKKKRSKSQPKRHSCTSGHTLYTAVCPVPPLYHIDPKDDSLLRNYGISMHSNRLFLTGCDHGHITLHDGLTGFSKVIGVSKFPITEVAIIHTHQHYSELTKEDYQSVLTNVRWNSKMEDYRCGRTTPLPQNTVTPNPDPTNIGNSQVIDNDDISTKTNFGSNLLYHHKTRVFPLVVSLDRAGTVMIWDAVACQLLSLYTQDRVNDEGAQPAPITSANMYNSTGLLKMSMCAIPLLPHVQRAERYGKQTIRPPLKTCYAGAQASVMAMIFNRYESQGFDLKTGLPLNNNNNNTVANTNNNDTTTLDPTRPANINPTATPLTFLNPPQYDTDTQPWSPFIGFPFHLASPKLNIGVLIQLDNPEEKSYIRPFIDPATSQPFNTISSGIDLITPLRTTFVAPTVVVTPYRKGQLTFCDLQNISCPTFYTFAHKQHVGAIAYVGGLLWTAGWDCVIKSWDLRYLSTPVHTIQSSQKHITAMCGFDDKYLIIATGEKQLKIFDIERLAINRTYSMHVLNDLEEYVKSVNFDTFNKALQENEHKLEKFQQKYEEYLKNTSPVIDHNDDIDTDEPPTVNDGEAKTEPHTLEELYIKLQIPPEEQPNSIAQLMKLDPFLSSPFTLLTIYPNLTFTQVFQQWLMTHNLTYIENRLMPLMTSYDVQQNCLVSNMLTVQKNHGLYLPVARNHNQRVQFSLDACLFDWDVNELIQTITTIDGVIITASKECKSKVGLSKFMGSITPWVTSIEVPHNFSFPNNE